MDKNSVGRMGNWYLVSVEGTNYHVLVEKIIDTPDFDPQSVRVFDKETFIELNDLELKRRVEILMEQMDGMWENDTYREFDDDVFEW